MKLTIKASERAAYKFVPKVIDFSIRHFRSTQQHKEGKGGFTVMTVNGPTTPYVVVSRCSDEENFSRSFGVEMCIKKYLHRNDFISDWCYLQGNHKFPLGDALTNDLENGVKSFTVFAIPHYNHKNL